MYFPHSIDAAGVVKALRHIRRYIKQPLIVICDRLRAHTAPVVRQYLAEDGRIEMELLPAYSPELNPEEYCHGYAKEQLRNSTPRTLAELVKNIKGQFSKIRQRPKLIRSFFAHAGIPLINLSG